MKIFLFLSDPIFWIAIIFCFSLFMKKKKWKILGIVLFAILTNNWLGYFALHLWESQTIQVENIQEPYEIAIVLGPFMNHKKSILDEELNIYEVNDRLRQSIELYKKGKFKKFLLAGNDEIDAAITFLLDEGISSEDILVEDRSSNTYENALFSKQLLTKRANNSKSILLITSAYHMRRAQKCFNAVALNVTPFSVDYMTYCAKVWGVSLGEIIPNSSATRKWGVLFREVLSIFYFKLKGYL